MYIRFDSVRLHATDRNSNLSILSRSNNSRSIRSSSSAGLDTNASSDAVVLSAGPAFGAPPAAADTHTPGQRPDLSSAEKARIPRPTAPPVHEPDPCKIFVGGCPADTDEGVLRHHFGKYGDIKLVEVKTHRQTTKCKGFAFVTFCEEEAARQAVLFRHENMIRTFLLIFERFWSFRRKVSIFNRAELKILLFS